MVVSLPVGRVRILVGVKIFFRLALVEFAHRADGAVRAVGGIGINNVGAVGVENSLAFDGNVFRHAQRDRKTFGSADHGVGDSGIAAGGVEQSFPGSKFSA